jgi:hypothetical protein
MSDKSFFEKIADGTADPTFSSKVDSTWDVTNGISREVLYTVQERYVDKEGGNQLYYATRTYDRSRDTEYWREIVDITAK